MFVADFDIGEDIEHRNKKIIGSLRQRDDLIVSSPSVLYRLYVFSGRTLSKRHF